MSTNAMEALASCVLGLARDGFGGPIEMRLPKDDFYRLVAEVESANRHSHNPENRAEYLELNIGPIPLKVMPL